MSVRAKFGCLSVRATEYGRVVELAAVYSSSPDDPNRSWAATTPSGNLTMIITNPQAYEQFEVGKDYFLDFSLAPPSPA